MAIHQGQSKLKILIKAIRLPFFTATIVPVTLGSIVAWYDTGSFIWVRFFLAMTGALFMHAGTNLANDYFDHVSGCDEANATPTPFSGGSRVIQDGLIPPKKMLYLSLAFFTFGGIIGLYLNYLCGTNTIIILAAIGIFLGFFYSAKPFSIGYGGLGEIATGIGFGPLMVMGSYYAQTQNLPFKPFLISLPVGILIALVLFINEFPDYAADKNSGKNTLVVILNKRRAIALYHILLLSVYTVIVSLIIVRLLPIVSLMVFFSAPLALRAYNISKKNFDKIYELLPVNASTIGLHSLIGILLCFSFILDKIF